jgi:hypothetical protein
LPQISDDTQELLDRAQRAIDRSVALREQSRKGIASAEAGCLRAEMNLYGRRAIELHRENRDRSMHLVAVRASWKVDASLV